MNLKTFSIASELENLGVALEERSYVLSLAVARAVGYQLALPTSPVDNPYTHFTELHKGAVEALLAQINERIVVDINAVCDLVCRLWIFRYRLVFDPKNAAVRQFLDACVRVGSRELPPKVSEWMIKYEQSDALDRLTSCLTTALTEEG